MIVSILHLTKVTQYSTMDYLESLISSVTATLLSPLAMDSTNPKTPISLCSMMTGTMYSQYVNNKELYNEVCRYFDETEEEKGIYCTDTISVYHGRNTLRK